MNEGVKAFKIKAFSVFGNDCLFTRARVAYGALFLSHPEPCGNV